ncbi:MAG: cytochrome c biogenesis CcdA family protein [Bacillota bacterium]|nr:cytochrome c biogenesis CcdA family protein [Bacillota bacterium]
MPVLMVFLEGVLAFLSPCILPMLPVYLVYLAGDEAAGRQRRVINTLGFIIGFTLIYVALGATATSIGRALFRNQDLLRRVSGVIMLVLGLHYLGLFDRLHVWLRSRFIKGDAASPGERMLNQHSQGRGFLRSLLFGLAFTVTWTPCLTAWVGAAMTMAANSATVWQGIGLLFAFSMGLGIPFMLTALLYESMATGFAFIKRHMQHIRLFSGLLLILIGILMLTNLIGRYMSFFS